MVARTARGAMANPAAVDHVADFCHRYPGEVVTFYTRIAAGKRLSNLTLRISLPQEMAYINYLAPSQLPNTTPSIEATDNASFLVWSLPALAAGAPYEFQTTARIASTQRNLSLESRATLTDADDAIMAEETMAITVSAKGKYLRFLPELYDQDELMGRLLMLFESFWSPIETQAQNIHHYFDPEMTPPDFVPWLASWMNLVLDEHLPGERRRRLLKNAVPLFRRRGTKQGLRDYLETYTDGKAQITEHRAWDFKLGTEARLGPSIALGRDNVPHTFTVRLHLPPVSVPDGANADEIKAREASRRRTIQNIIEMEKPAHTGYNLHLEANPGHEPGN